MTAGVYEIDCDKYSYIGSSKDVEKRWCQHLKLLRENKHNNKFLQRVFNKYGEDSFTFDIVENCDSLSEEDMRKRETYYILFFKNNFGSIMNLTFDAVAIGKREYSEKERMSRSKKGKERWASMTPEEKTFRLRGIEKGHFQTEETRKKISETLKGRKMSEEAVLKSSKKRTGQKRTLEQRKRMSEARKRFYQNGGKNWNLGLTYKIKEKNDVAR